MKYIGLAMGIVLVGCALIAPSAVGAQGNPTGDSTKKRTLVYKPPAVGAPIGRVGGGTRGFGDLPTLGVLAPNHPGLTSQEQPSLYWYLSRLTAAPIELTVTAEQAAIPLLETRLTPPSQPGIQRVRLADYNVRLTPGVRYRWFVALIPDPNNRSQDILAGGVIERTTPSNTLQTQLQQMGTAQAPYLYAESGLWYDAVEAISELIAAAPQDAHLRQQRAMLLEQVGLPDVAAYDRQQGQ
jgi:hypothetical protein